MSVGGVHGDAARDAGGGQPLGIGIVGWVVGVGGDITHVGSWAVRGEGVWKTKNLEARRQ